MAKSKSKDSYQLIVASYDSYDQGLTILNMIQEMKKAQTIKIEDAALVTKTEDGKLDVKETKEMTGRKGAHRGAVILGTIGLIFPPSFIASILVGGGIGALAGKLRDTGIKTDELEQFTQSLGPDQAAVLVIAEHGSVNKVKNSLKGYEGLLVTDEIPASAAAKLAESESMPAETASEPAEPAETPATAGDANG